MTISSLTRREFLSATALAPIAARLGAESRTRPVPSAAQLEWQRDELALFIHFGVNTFTDREWGDGTETPRIFAPSRLARPTSRSAPAGSTIPRKMRL